MAEELGRITRPATGNYQGKRKLLLTPLIETPLAPAEMPAEGAEIVGRYWEQVAVQVRAVQNALGSVARVYHENVPEGGAEGIRYLEASGQGSLGLVRELTEAGATLEATEAMEIMAEMLDWQRCLMQPLISPAVASRLQEWFAEANRRRYEFIASAIDAGIGDDETGLLVVNERHQIQFAGDIEVIYVAPPALDEFRRWVQNWAESWRRQMAAPGDETGEGDDAGDSGGGAGEEGSAG